MHMDYSFSFRGLDSFHNWRMSSYIKTDIAGLIIIYGSDTGIQNRSIQEAYSMEHRHSRWGSVQIPGGGSSISIPLIWPRLQIFMALNPVTAGIFVNRKIA
ncbi:unnamed protein product [Ilex paraguariensis]|uniref:Uncharacterized protein n=1 Tax=Ilex paraguariensis TaxID=185542 RepID=A0ABC8RKJ2_9AQUA